MMVMVMWSISGDRWWWWWCGEMRWLAV